MSSQMVSLAWDGHHKTLVSVFENMLECSNLVDCTIAAEGQKLKAHKEVLSAFSPYFELLFREETEENPTVILSGINFRDLRSLVYFLYHGTLEIPENRIQDLIDVAECLKIRGLADAREKEGSGKTNQTSGLCKLLTDSSFIPHKRTGEGQGEGTVNMLSQEADVNNTNNKNRSPPHLMWQSPAQNAMQNFDVQNVSGERSRPFIHTQSTLSSTERNILLLNGVSVVKIEPSLGGVENAMNPTRIASCEVNVCERHVNSFENNQEFILGTPSDVSVTSYGNHFEEFLPESPKLQFCSKDLLTSSVTKVDHVNMTSYFPSVDHTVSAAEIQNLFINSELVIKTEPNAEDKMFVSEGENMRTIYGECSETTLRDTGVPSVAVDMLAQQKDQCQLQNPFIHSELVLKTELSTEDKIYLPENDNLTKNGEHSESALQCTGVPSVSEAEMLPEPNDECGSDYSDAASRCAEEEPVPSRQQLPAVFVETAQRGTNKSAVRVLPGLVAESAETHASPATRVSHTTLCQSDFLALSKSDSRAGISSLEKQYCCQFCSCAFTLKSHLKRHQATTHIRLESHKCTECNYTSANRSVLKKHKGTHKAKKQYKCLECDYTAAYSSSMIRHQRTHTGIKPYKCTECDFTTADSCYLKTHQRIHCGVKPYKCLECVFTAADRSSLKRHQRTHSGVKPYKCSECDYTAAVSSSLKIHKRTHSGIKPYKCTECDYTTAVGGNLKRHEQTHSGI